MQVKHIEPEVQNLCSAKLGHIVRLAQTPLVRIDSNLLHAIKQELIRRNCYESELNRRTPH